MSDDDAVAALGLLSRTEGILTALESAHAVAYATRLAQQIGGDQKILINLSGRGDKDVASIKDRADGAN